MLLLHRVFRRSPPNETGDMTEPTSTARERLLSDHTGKDDYSGDNALASRLEVSGHGGAVDGEARSSHRE